MGRHHTVTRPINDPPFEPRTFYTIKQFAEAMAWSTDTVRREIRKGRLRAVRLTEGGREYRLRGSVLNDYIAELETGK